MRLPNVFCFLLSLSLTSPLEPCQPARTSIYQTRARRMQPYIRPKKIFNDFLDFEFSKGRFFGFVGCEALCFWIGGGCYTWAPWAELEIDSARSSRRSGTPNISQVRHMAHRSAEGGLSVIPLCVCVQW